MAGGTSYTANPMWCRVRRFLALVTLVSYCWVTLTCDKKNNIFELWCVIQYFGFTRCPTQMTNKGSFLWTLKYFCENICKVLWDIEWIKWRSPLRGTWLPLTAGFGCGTEGSLLLSLKNKSCDEKYSWYNFNCSFSRKQIAWHRKCHGDNEKQLALSWVGAPSQ